MNDNFNKKKLLIVNRAQFGYHIDTYYYCKYLRGSFDITYLGWDYQKPYIQLENINIIYVSRKYSKVIRYFNFLFKCISESRKNYNLVFINYFPLCILVKYLSSNKKHVVDVRTGYIEENHFKLKLLNSILSWETGLFENITIISSSLASKLRLNKNKLKIIPLGADIISNKNKSFDTMKLIYVGTFHLRNIEKSIFGFARFYKENKLSIKMNYIIIGDGYNEEDKYFEEIIKQAGLEGIVRVVGPVKHENLKHYFDEQNIGVSFIPMTPYFDCQPPTKTFEYMLSGMPVIATSTYENMRLIDNNNGVLIQDNEDSFYNGLNELAYNKKLYDSNAIRKFCKKYTWKNIVNDDLKNYFLKVLK